MILMLVDQGAFWYVTDPVTILEPNNPQVDGIEPLLIYRLTDFDAFKLCKGRSGWNFVGTALLRFGLGHNKTMLSNEQQGASFNSFWPNIS